MRPISFLLAIVAAACSATGNSPKASGRGIAFVDSGASGSTEVWQVDPASTSPTPRGCVDGLMPQLQPSLSDDTVVPSQPQPDHQLLLIDRRNARLVWIAPAGCTLVRQLDVGTGFDADPRDVVVLSATKAYVSRPPTNGLSLGQAGRFDGGDDLLIIDPSAGTLSGRIDLSGQATSASVHARPDRMLLVDGKVWVALGSSSDDGKTVGHGRVVAIDPAHDTVVAAIDLPALKGCSGLDYLPATKDLVVGCGGDPNDTPDNQTAESGLALVNIGAAAPSVMTTVGGAAAGNRPLSAAAFAAIGDDFLLAVSPGAGATPDSLWRVQLDSTIATHVLDGAAAGVFGAVVWDAGRQRAYVTDADPNAPTVRVLDVANAIDTHQTATFAAGAASSPPPRAMAFY